MCSLNRGSTDLTDSPSLYCVQQTVLTDFTDIPPSYCVHQTVLSDLTDSLSSYCVYQTVLSDLTDSPSSYCVYQTVLSDRKDNPSPYCVYQTMLSDLIILCLPDSVVWPHRQPVTSLHLRPSFFAVSCMIWEGNECKKLDLTAMDIGWAIIDKVDNLPESSDYIFIGVTLSLCLGCVPFLYRFYSTRDVPTEMSTQVFTWLWTVFRKNSWGWEVCVCSTLFFIHQWIILT